jgi:hypothetical protein
MKSSEHKAAKEKATRKPETNTFPPKDSNDNNLCSLRNNSFVSGFDCSLCQVKCTRKKTFNDHLIGKQHKKKLEMLQAPKRNFRCEICNVKANDQGGLDMHLAGKKHKKKVYQKKSKWSAYM